MSATTAVLFVEDDDDLRESLEAYLDLAGFAVTAVPDGRSFRRELDERRFAVVVIDLGLPDEEGEGLVGLVRRTTDAMIVVVTARDTLAARVDCYRLGADLFLRKPVDGLGLAAAIGDLSWRRGAGG